MPKHLSYFANAVMFAIIVSDGKTARRNKLKYQEVCETNDRLIDALALSQDQVNYLLSIMKKNDLPELTEFDLIALHNLNFTVKETE